MTKSPKYTSIVRRRAYKAKIKALEEEFEATKKEQQKFISSLIHEFRAPLNSIIGFSALMLEHPKAYDDKELPVLYRQDVSEIHRSATNLLKINNDFLDFAKLQAGVFDIHMRALEINSVIESIMAKMRDESNDKPINLTYQIDDSADYVHADEIPLKQVLLNLYSNSIRFTKQGSITLKITDLDDGNLQFALTDTGEGINPETQKIITQQLEVSLSKYPVYPRIYRGLGLAIAYQIVKLMGGKLWLESVEGQGTTVYFTLQKYTGQE